MRTLPFRLETAIEEQTGTATIPEIDTPENSGSDYRVILYNDEWHGLEEVVEQVIKATGCTPERAVEITLEAHNRGRAVCFRNSRERCHQAAGVLRQIRLQCEVDCD
jgi:ATP-dependent Clp protease adaptor protein ClpS